MSNPTNESRIDSNEAAADMWELQKELALAEVEAEEQADLDMAEMVRIDAYLANVESELRESGEFPYETCGVSDEGLAAVIEEGTFG